MMVPSILLAALLSAGTPITSSLVETPVVVEALGDKTPPEVSMTLPVSGEVITRFLVWAGQVSDETQLATVYFTLDDLIIPFDLEAFDIKVWGFGASWDVTNFPDGRHLVGIGAEDTSGNTTFVSVPVIFMDGKTFPMFPLFTRYW